jgi:hypothetical protein
MISYLPFKPETFVARGYKTSVETEDILHIITNHDWAPEVWKDGHRREANFLYADLLVLDFDDGVVSLDQAISMFKEYQHIIGPTKSHKKEKNGKTCDRFRVVIPFSERITEADKYKATSRFYARKWSADLAATDAAHQFKPCTSIASYSYTGNRVNVIEPRPKKNAEYYKVNTSEPLAPFVMKLQAYGAENGERNAKCFSAAKHLFMRGYKESDVRSIIFARVDLLDSEKNNIIRNALNKATQPK